MLRVTPRRCTSWMATYEPLSAELGKILAGRAAPYLVDAVAFGEIRRDRLSRPGPSLGFRVAALQKQRHFVEARLRCKDQVRAGFVDPGQPIKIRILPVVLGNSRHLALRGENADASIERLHHPLAPIPVHRGRKVRGRRGGRMLETGGDSRGGEN